MNSLLIIFLDLIRLRRGPQDLPSSQFLLLVLGFLLMVTAILSDHMSKDIADKLVFSLAQVAILTATVWGILAMNKKSERAIQTLTAVFGTSVLIQIVVWPFRTWLLSLPEDAQKQTSVPLFFVMVLAIWSFVVMVHIYRNSLDTSKGKAIVMTVITQMIVGLLMLTLFADKLQMEMAK